MVLPPALPVTGMGKMREDVFIETSSSNQSRRGFFVLNGFIRKVNIYINENIKNFNNINERINI
jgi:hypothetical protein